MTPAKRAGRRSQREAIIIGSMGEHSDNISAKFRRLMAYSDRYHISFQMWPNQYTIFIEKDFVPLWDFGSDEPVEVMRRALEYLDRINKKP